MNNLVIPTIATSLGIILTALIASLAISTSAGATTECDGISRYTDPKLTLKSLSTAENNLMYEGADGITASAEEIKNLSSLVALEVGGESEEEIRAVTETVLNRVKSDSFPNTLNGVIFQQSDGYLQYSPAYQVGETEPNDKITEIVIEVFTEGNEICDSDIYYFRADYYHTWSGAVSEFNIGNTYFSSSIWVD